MNKFERNNSKPANLLQTLFKSFLISLPAMLITSIAIALPKNELPPVNPNLPNQAPSNNPGTSTKPRNPSPKIFNEPPYNRSQRITPTNSRGKPLLQTVPGAEVQPPLPEERQAPTAIITPVNGKINIKLTNATNAIVTYQVIGDTNPRTLAGKSDITLQNLKTPVTLTLERQDRGLLKVNPQAILQGLLEVTLTETTTLEEGKGTVRVEAGGQVFVN